MGKRWLLAVVGLLLVLASAVPVFADERTTADQAAILNQLSLLQGDGSGFQLDSGLKRSEAIAFIVRLMGKEPYVLANKAKYRTTSFSDVSPDAWFAPYVGYCAEQQIVSGFPDGGFHPEEYVSEKAFLKLVMGVLGYKEGADFTWGTVFASAYSLGLVTDSSYLTQVADNPSYLRGEVVQVLYRSLTKPTKDRQKTVIDVLLAEHAVSRAVAVQYGLAQDLVKTAIDSAAADSGTSVTVKLNEPVQPIAGSQVLVYETSHPENKLTAAVKAQTDGQLELTTSLQKESVSYTVKLSNIADADGIVTASVAGTFTGYVQPAVHSDFFLISKVVPVSKSVIDVYFTQPVNLNVRIPQNYEVWKDGKLFVKGDFSNMALATRSSDPYVVTMYLKDAMINGSGDYTLKLGGSLSSIYGVQLNDGKGDSRSFAANAEENQNLYITNVQVIDQKTVQLQFSKEVDLQTATQPSNYSITDSNGVPRGVIKAVVDAGAAGTGGSTVRLGIAGTLDPAYGYQLTVQNVSDSLNQIVLPKTLLPFTAQGAAASTDLKIVNASAEDQNTVIVYFNKRPDPSAVTHTFYYTVTGISNPGYSAQPAQVYYDISKPYMAKLFLPTGKEVIAGSSYKLAVLSALPDDLGNLSSAGAEATFSGTANMVQKPFIQQATLIGQNAILVHTSREVSLSGTNVAGGNYTLEYTSGDHTLTKTAVSVSGIDATTLVLTFDSLSETESYTLKFASLSDYTGTQIRTAADGQNTIAVAAGR